MRKVCDEMTQEFIYVSHFYKKWRAAGLDDEALRLLEDFVMENPETAPIMAGTGGLRKLRWALPGKGKSGGIRVLYVSFIRHKKIYMVDMFTKEEKENLSQDERNKVKQAIQMLAKEVNSHE